MTDFALSEKLSRLRRLIEESAERAPPLRLARDLPQAGGGAVAAVRAGLPDGPLPVESLVPGTEETTSYGPYFLSRSAVPMHHRHGRWPIEAAIQVTAAGIRWLAHPSALEEGDLLRALFVDVETTGLAGGTGTIPFLIGLGRFAGDQFVIWQYLMRGPEEERAVLSAVAEAAAGGRMVVSFNGKGFDLPLLETRFVLGRMPFPFPGEHLDLLFAARRIWGMRLESCRLASLEAAVLGVHRRQDIPGALVPQLYHDYLRTGDGRCLAPVFDHNLLDVLSLVTLVGRLGQLHRDPLKALEDAPEDLVAIGRCFERKQRRRAPGAGPQPPSGEGPAGDEATGLACYREALAAGLRGAIADTAKLRLSLLEKRVGRHGVAARYWEELAQSPADARVRRRALIELAKYHEHVSKDLARAAECAAAAGDLGASPVQKEALRGRRERLRRKLSAAVARGPRRPAAAQPGNPSAGPTGTPPCRHQPP